MSSADTDTVEEESAPTDEVREALLAKFQERFGEGVVGSHIVPGKDLWVRVTREIWVEVHEFAKIQLGFGFFEYLSAIDWMPSPYGKSEDATVDAEEKAPVDLTPVQGYAGGETRFQVISRLFDVENQHIGVHFKCDVPDDDLTIPSILRVFAGVNWHERELHEMFGITAVGHPFLANLYLPTDFEGHPLRKDFPLVARMVKPWPGIVDVEPMPDSDDDEEAEGDAS